MKRIPSRIGILTSLVSIIFIIITFSFANIACTQDESGETEEMIEDNLENGANGDDEASGKEKPDQEEITEPSYKVLYHLTRNKVSKTETAGTECYLFNFHNYLDGGDNQSRRYRKQNIRTKRISHQSY
ncbi:MAG: hypothetical protein U9O59_08630 [Actinomycetota bacterium]|nr:hypothetical protein [Actinomycetota bacterium]